MPDNKTCAGCGWAFADGGETHEVTGDDLELPLKSMLAATYRICGPCHHISGELGQMYKPATRRGLNRMTNLLLKAIRDGEVMHSGG